MTTILGFIVVGLFVGLLARLFMPGRDRLGILATIALGIVGAVIGGLVGQEVFHSGGGVHWILSILAAMLLLWVARAVGGGRARI